MHKFDVSGRLGEIRCQVLLLYGANDIFFPVEDGVGIMAQLGDLAQMRVLHKC